MALSLYSWISALGDDTQLSELSLLRVPVIWPGGRQIKGETDFFGVSGWGELIFLDTLMGGTDFFNITDIFLVPQESL